MDDDNELLKEKYDYAIECIDEIRFLATKNISDEVFRERVEHMVDDYLGEIEFLERVQ